MVQRLNAELEIASSILGARPSLVVSRGLNKNNCEMKVLSLPREGLDASRGSYKRPHKVAVPSLTVGVKIVSSISTLVLNSSTSKESAFFARSIMFQVHVSLFCCRTFWFCDDPLTSACPRPAATHDPGHYPNSKIQPPFSAKKNASFPSITSFSSVLRAAIGTLRGHDGDENKNVKNAIG